jgi:hypothetical protein
MKPELEALAERVAALEERAEKHAEALERVCGILEKMTGVKPSAPKPETHAWLDTWTREGGWARVEAKEVREHMYANDHWVACDYSLCQKPHRTVYVPKEKK